MKKVITDEQKIDQILNRGIIKEIFPNKEEFKKILLSGKRLRFYIGFDATASTLHLSHAKNIMLLEKFRELGHEVILLFGDFTARIGDPSGQAGTREIISAKEVSHNIISWKKQIKNLISFKDRNNPAKIKFNSRWLASLSFEKVLELASKVTVQQLIERDMFQKRIKEGKHIFFHEFMYPLMQGYDSVAMEVDVELCGTDQTFNALMGRTLLRKMKNKEKFVVAVNLMENPKTQELMSKSKGTGVFLNTNPTEMFGAIMAQPDEMLEVLIRNCTDLPIPEKEIFQNPMETKLMVAQEIIKKIFNSEKKAIEARKNFSNVFQKKSIPDDLLKIKERGQLGKVVLKYHLINSMSEWRRLIQEGAIKKIENQQEIKIDDPKIETTPGVYKIGKRNFVKII